MKGPRTPPNTPPPQNVSEYDERMLMKSGENMNLRHIQYNNDSMTSTTQYHQVILNKNA